jgi:hypothetical protein
MLAAQTDSTVPGRGLDALKAYAALHGLVHIEAFCVCLVINELAE